MDKISVVQHTDVLYTFTRYVIAINMMQFMIGGVCESLVLVKNRTSGR